MLRALEAMSKHWEITATLLAATIVLSIIAGMTISSIWENTAKSVCFAHHKPAECDPSLRTKSADEVARLNEMYLRCISEHTTVSESSLCQNIYQH